MESPAGKIVKGFGTEGEVIINLYDSFPRNFNIEEPLFVEIDNLAVPLFLSSFERRGVSGAIVRIDDFDSEQRSAQLLGREIYLKTDAGESDEEPDDGEIYLEDFVGYSASFRNSDVRGKVVDFSDSDLNPLFVIDIDGEEILVPAADDLIETFSTSRRTVMFDLPEGLLDLNRK